MTIGGAVRRTLQRLSPTRDRWLTARAVQIALGTPFSLAELASRPRAECEAIVRGLCHNAYLGGDTSLCRVLGRFQMFVDTSDLGLTSHLLTHGFWEMWHTQAMVRLVQPGMTAVDAGANLGYFTLVLAELVGERGQVHAFEPNPAIADRLGKSVYVNGFTQRVTVHEAALGEAAGELTLMVPPNEPKNAHLMAPDDRRPGRRVAVRRIDQMPELLEADFVKIDVEGAEEAVWRGMNGLFATGRPLTVILEFTLNRYPDANAFVDALLRPGFSLAVIDPLDGIVAVDRAWLLSRPPAEDQLLVLRR